MERINLGQSVKNIPMAQPNDYLKCLIEKTESLLRRMRWKGFFFLNPQAEPQTKETFGFNTTKSPKPVPELNAFENKMINMIQNVELKNTNCKFQNELSQTVKDIKKDNTLLISADKTFGLHLDHMF